MTYIRTNVLGSFEPTHVRDREGGDLDIDTADFTAVMIFGLDASHLYVCVCRTIMIFI